MSVRILFLLFPNSRFNFQFRQIPSWRSHARLSPGVLDSRVIKSTLLFRATSPILPPSRHESRNPSITRTVCSFAAHIVPDLRTSYPYHYCYLLSTAPTCRSLSSFGTHAPFHTLFNHWKHAGLMSTTRSYWRSRSLGFSIPSLFVLTISPLDYTSCIL